MSSHLTLLNQLTNSNLEVSSKVRLEQKPHNTTDVEYFFKKAFSLFLKKRISRSTVNCFAKRVNKFKQNLSHLSDEELKLSFTKIALEFKKTLEDRHLEYLFACIGSAIYRLFKIYPHPVQFMGAYILLTGRLAEMPTGEGKTLVAGIASTLMAGLGYSVHVLTTNAYLAERDQQELNPLFTFFNIDSCFLAHDMDEEDKKAGYQKKICYISANELVFDYLKDDLSLKNNLSKKLGEFKSFLNPREKKAKPLIPNLHFCIVDEADSIFIDEAQTPMILSQESEGLIEENIIYWAMQEAKKLIINVDFKVHYASRFIELHENNLSKIILPPIDVRPIWYNIVWQIYILKQALMAIFLYQKDHHYLIQDNKIQIIDESTGRVMADRSWEHGLHQLIEAKENLELTKGKETLSKITFQQFFKRYFILSGLTGTGLEVYQELWTTYNLKVCQLPPNIPSKRIMYPTKVFLREQEKYTAILEDVKKLKQEGRAVLIGTRNIESSEKISNLFKKFNLEHVLLNAREKEQEAKIIADAGRVAQVTIATNMAGRGTDIKLEQRLKNKGGLHVILTESHESKRVDRQLIGRAARQGDPGSAVVYISNEESLLRQHTNAYLWITSFLPFLFLKKMWLIFLIKKMQHRCQKQARFQRAAVLKNEQKLRSQIGFSGKMY